MNVPTDYDDDVERLLTYPDILPKIKPNKSLSASNRSILLKAGRTKKRAKISFATAVSFDNKSTATVNYKFRRTLSKLVKKQGFAPLKHCRSVLYCPQSRRSASSQNGSSCVKRITRQHAHGQTKSTRMRPTSDDAARQWGRYQSMLVSSSLLPRQ